MTEQYRMIVIGGGAAGLTAAAFAGELGAKVALIEKEKLGGDCTWVGCVPSKALLKVAKVAHHMRTADAYGIKAVEPEIDMQQVKQYLQKVVTEIYSHETPDVFKERGVETIPGTATFIDAHTVEVANAAGETRQLRAEKFVIATGATAFVPPIDGLARVNYHTNATFFENDRLPEHVVILGAGAIAMEMAQAYRRLGANVTVIGMEIMPRDDADAKKVLIEVFEREGIRIIEGKLTHFESDDGIHFTATMGNGETLSGDMLLVATGRAATVNGIGLENAGVKYDKSGIHVNKQLQTSAPHIYAVGDCNNQGYRLTHYAGFEGGIGGRNAILPVVNSTGYTELVPFVTFTDPELAQVGLTEKAAREKFGDEVKVYMLPMTEGDRALAENDRDGFVKIVYRGRNEMLGATVLAGRAGEMIVEFTQAIKSGGVSSLRGVMHAYPTYSDIVQKAGSKVYIKELQSGMTGQVIDGVTGLLFGKDD